MARGAFAFQFRSGSRLKIRLLAHRALRTGPVGRDGLPRRTGLEALTGAALRFVVDVVAVRAGVAGGGG